GKSESQDNTDYPDYPGGVERGKSRHPRMPRPERRGRPPSLAVGGREVCQAARSRVRSRWDLAPARGTLRPSAGCAGRPSHRSAPGVLRSSVPASLGVGADYVTVMKCGRYVWLAVRVVSV